LIELVFPSWSPKTKCGTTFQIIKFGSMSASVS